MKLSTIPTLTRRACIALCAAAAVLAVPHVARAQCIPVKAVAVLGAGSLTQLVTHQDEHIESPRKLKTTSGRASTQDWTVIAMQAGSKVEILPADVYFKSMAQAVLVSDESSQKNPQLVQKLVRPTLKGMRDIMANPKEAARADTEHVTVHKGKVASIEQTAALYNKYVNLNQKVHGRDEARLADLQKFYVANGVVPSAASLKDLYANQFVTAK